MYPDRKLVLLFVAVTRSRAAVDCDAFSSSCAACTTAHYDAALPLSCSWNPMKLSCIRSTKNNDTLHYESECPLGPIPYPPNPPEFLPDWMSFFHQAQLFDEVTLLDLCLPGTHDSLSYDLSLVISADGSGTLQRWVAFLKKLSHPGELEDFFRTQAKTQQLSITQQLDNGVRFFDLRMMRQPVNGRWYSVHFMQSQQTIETYWHEIRNWLDLHPHEIVVLWLSRDGNPAATGPDQYPNVTSEQKQAIWQNFTTIFGDLLIHTDEVNLWTDSVTFLIQRNYRVVPFVSDYHDFSQSSPLALDAARIQNVWNLGDVFDAEDMTFHLKDYFQNAKVNNVAVHKRHGFTLLGMNTASPEWQVVASAEKRFLGWKHDRRCSSHFQTPEATHWCPETLLDIVQLSSYYAQSVLEYAYDGIESKQLAFPNAIYLDALDWGGTIRTGSQLLNGHDRGGAHENKISTYGYVDTVLSYNAQIACANDSQNQGCALFRKEMARRKELHPHRLWDDPNFARYSSWPSFDSGEQLINTYR